MSYRLEPRRATPSRGFLARIASGFFARLLILFALAIHGYAAVDGIVINQTTGKPQPNVAVSLIQPGQQGMQTLGSMKSDAEGKFKFDKVIDGPALLQALYGGVPYNKMLPPGAPSSGIQVPVYESTADADTAQLTQHMVLLQPNDKGLRVNEMYLMGNATKATYNDLLKGTLRFYLPPGHGDVRVTVSSPGGMPVQRSAEPAGAADVYKVTYPLRPGDTRFDLTYAIAGGAKEFEGKVLVKGGSTRLVVPDGVTLEGENIEQLGIEPQTKAKIFGVKGDSYTVKVSGTGSLAVDGGGAGEGGPEEDTGQPRISQSNPRIYKHLYVVLGLSLAILAAGFVLLYRSRA